jgi:TPR repeat protein
MLWWKPFGRHERAQVAALQEQVADLHEALVESRAIANRWTSFRRSFTAALLTVALAVGFALGVYHEQIRIALAALPYALRLSTPRSADAAEAAYGKGRYPAALRLARPLANDGDPRAQTLLGLINYHGRDIPKNDSEAMKWFRLAAEQGNAEARFHLGIMYDEGQVVPQDHTEAAKWYLLAASQGNAQAQYNLGLAYAKGEGVAQDNVQAHVWLNLSATRFTASDRSRAAAIRNRDVVAGKMTPEELAEAQRLAREWRPR